MSIHPDPNPFRNCVPYTPPVKVRTFAVSHTNDKDFFSEFPELNTDDREEMARNILEASPVPYSHPRARSLARWAANGNGHFSRLLLASGIV
jgi:hypothetical protein